MVVTEEYQRDRKNQRISMGTDLEVLSSFDLIITSTSGSVCVSEAEEQIV